MFSFISFRLLLTVALFIDATAMFHKRGLPDLSALPAEKRLRSNIADLFLTNDISGCRAKSIYDDAKAAGVVNLTGLTSSSSSNIRSAQGNANRDLTKKLLKNQGWCQPYYAYIRVWDRKSQKEVRKWVPFLLPHEILFSLAICNDVRDLLGTDGMCDASKQHLDSIQPPADNMIGLGLWSDGCPCNYDRTQSLEVWSLNLPGLVGNAAEMRIPVCVIQKRYLVKHGTADDIMSVLTWSFQCCAVGKMPDKRHDGIPWLQLDAQRKKFSSREIGVRGCLVEVRGDWIMYSDTFRLPSWSNKHNICWRCTATKADIRKTGSDASWRAQRRHHYDVIQVILAKGLSLPPLLSCPWFQTRCFLIDWLHVADLGTTADFIGSFFYLVLLPKMRGASNKERCSHLFVRIRAFYRSTHAENQLNDLVPTMFHSKKKGFKLSAKAAETRGLVPFCKQAAHDLLDRNDVSENTVIAACDALSEMYDCLAADVFTSQKLADACRRFCTLAVALESTTAVKKGWRVKPKLHLLQEMCEMSDNRPSQMWTYRDESFGGDMAKAARARGGKNTPLQTGRNVLLKFCAKHRVPRF